MIYITGDTHASFGRFSENNFPEQKNMTRDDYVIICGDFGGVWNYKVPSLQECHRLECLSKKPFTILFVDGNHENFDRLKDYPRVKFHGGMAHRIHKNIYHLMRGYVFDFDGKKFFAFGGARSHDIQDGILDPKDYKSLVGCIDDYIKRSRMGQTVRINHVSWWKDELPSNAEMKRGIDNLRKVDFKVDYVITHCLPERVTKELFYNSTDKLTLYFNKLCSEYGLQFKEWHCGHYHCEKRISNFVIHYNDIIRLF